MYAFDVQDGLFLVTNDLDLVRGYTLAVLTPNVNEYKRLVKKVLDSEVNDEDPPGQLLSLSKRSLFLPVLNFFNGLFFSQKKIDCIFEHQHWWCICTTQRES